MLQAYSSGIDVAANAAIPFNNVKLQKGCTALLSAPATIQFNKCGVYALHCNISAEGTGEVNIDVYKNNVLEANEGFTVTATAGEVFTGSFDTLVQVPFNNSNCCCASPTVIQIFTDTALTDLDANIVVTKIC